MGRMKNWLMEMQEYAYALLDEHEAVRAREEFLHRYPNQQDVFDGVLKEWSNQ